MRKRAIAISSTLLTLSVLAVSASPITQHFGIECGSLGLPDRQILIRIPSNPAGLRLDVTTAPALPRSDGTYWTSLRVRAGTDSLSCEATEPGSFILDLRQVSATPVRPAIATDRTIALEAETAEGLPRGSMELGPSATGTFTW
jgi:hypothetical protein